jgi:hypothetical protein
MFPNPEVRSMPANIKPRLACLALLAALLIGAAPPVEREGPMSEADWSGASCLADAHPNMIGSLPIPCSIKGEGDTGPSLLLETNAWDVSIIGPAVPPTTETVMVNHVFAVPLGQGSLIPGDENFLIYPPDLSDASEHLGEGIAGPGLDAEIVPVDFMGVGDPGRWSRYLGGAQTISIIGCGYSICMSPPDNFSLILCHTWDVIAPIDFLSGFWRQAEPKPGCVHLLFTGEVPTGRELLVKSPQTAETPKPTSGFNMLPFGLFSYKSLEDVLATDLAPPVYEEWWSHLPVPAC